MAVVSGFTSGCGLFPVYIYGKKAKSNCIVSSTEVIGLMAAACTTFSFLPQIIKTLRTRDTSGISFTMYSIFCIGILLWLTYGIIKKDVPIIAANAITLCFGVIMIVFAAGNRK